MCTPARARQFEKIVTAAIQATVEDFSPYILSTMGSAGYVHEFRTIHVDMGRRVGKTRYIAKHSRYHDLIIVPSWDCAERMRGYPGTVKVALELRDLPFLDLTKYHWIWVDEPSMCQHNYGRKDILSAAKVNGDTMIIKLGA